MVARSRAPPSESSDQRRGDRATDRRRDAITGRHPESSNPRVGPSGESAPDPAEPAGCGIGRTLRSAVALTGARAVGPFVLVPGTQGASDDHHSVGHAGLGDGRSSLAEPRSDGAVDDCGRVGVVAAWRGDGLYDWRVHVHVLLVVALVLLLRQVISGRRVTP
jgi:hypothetical protein